MISREFFYQIGRRTREKMDREIAAAPGKDIDLNFRNEDRWIMLGGIILGTAGAFTGNQTVLTAGLVTTLAETVTFGQLTRVAESTIETLF